MSKYFQIPLNVNNVQQRQRPTVLTSGFRFPTTQEVELLAVELGKDLFDEPSVLVNKLFTNDTTYASKIEVQMVRNQPGESGGMTLVHHPDANVLPFETRGAKFDLVSQSWSPIHFKESKEWNENEMLYLGNLTEEVASSQFEGQVASFVAWMLQRMETRRRWMLWQVLTTGKVVIDNTDVYNPSGLSYDIQYGLTDMEINMGDKFDEVTGSGAERKSKVDPIEFFLDMKKTARWKPEIMPHTIIVNSMFKEVLADNTFMQYRIDYERGWTAIEMRPPRSVYLEAAFEAFKRETGLNVILDDSTYKDGSGNVQYWLPHGRMVILNQHDGPLGEFVWAGHLAGIAENGAVQIGTGPYINVLDYPKEDRPRYSILGGFAGLPRISSGYHNVTFENHRIKWMDYTTTGFIQSEYSPTAFPTAGDLQPLGAVPSPTGF